MILYITGESVYTNNFDMHRQLHLQVITIIAVVFEHSVSLFVHPFCPIRSDLFKRTIHMVEVIQIVWVNVMITKSSESTVLLFFKNLLDHFGRSNKRICYFLVTGELVIMWGVVSSPDDNIRLDFISHIFQSILKCYSRRVAWASKRTKHSCYNRTLSSKGVVSTAEAIIAVSNTSLLILQI